MPKTAKPQAPGAVLQSFIDEYQINAFSLSKSIKTAYQSVTNILKGKGRISVQIALRLAQFFGNSPKYWLDVQSSYEIKMLSQNAKFVKTIKGISKAEKSSGRAKKTTSAKTAGKKAKASGKKGRKASTAKKTRAKK